MSDELRTAYMNVDALTKHYDELLKNYNNLQDERDALRKQLDIAVEALKPFSDTNNWMWGGETDCGYPYSPEWNGDDSEPWVTAQEALKQLEAK